MQVDERNSHRSWLSCWSRVSTKAADAFTAGIKGRFHEIDIADDHQLLSNTYPLLQHLDGKFVTNQVPAISAINARLVDDYVADCENIECLAQIDCQIGRWLQAGSVHHIDSVSCGYRSILQTFSREAG